MLVGLRSDGSNNCRKSREWLLTAILLSIASMACREQYSAVWAGSIDTLENGAVLISNPTEGMWLAGSGWRLEEEVKIGTRGGGPAGFGDVADLDVDRFGRIYVLDRQAQEVRVFDGDGSWIRNIGRRGGGPGEFRGVTGIAFDPAGRLWVLNQGNIRYSVFDTSGVLLKELPRLMGVRVTEWFGVFDRWGALYDLVFYATATGMTFAYGRYDTTTGRFVDTIPGVGFPSGAPLFLGVQLGTQHGWWLADATEYRLWHTDLVGDTVRVVERAYDRIPLSSKERDSLAQEMKQLRKRARNLPRVREPRHRPIFAQFMEDEERNLYVMLSPPSGSRVQHTNLDVFDPNGMYLGAMHIAYSLERSPRPVVRGSRIYAVTKDDLDVPYIVILRIRGRD